MNFEDKKKNVRKAIGANIKKYREQKNLTKAEFAKQLSQITNKEIARPSITGWENGDYSPELALFYDIAKVLSVNINDLLENTNYQSNVEPIQISHNVVKIPVYGTIPAGTPTEMIDDSFIEDYEEIDADLLRGGNKYFGLIVKGSSMYPEFKDGDVLIIKQTPDCENGDYCAVSINCTECTFKKIIKDKNGIVLQPINSAYSPQFFSNEEINDLPISILGKVIEVRRKF